ncbi:probable WRKY transcription factor 4 isoform X2 [Andrographis paniculata]|uniref:probable WRKY transcription factor 4 isoform X2 n=1 Tax=Andrographis paniculata TaxID=175694 RepID=UPI0021E776EC|nr:probable WRKY transcription factor 4 isoform X2 [Andrographis paniculata]
MGETTVEDAAKKPTIVVPQRGSMESFFTNGLSSLGFSPGPITLVSGMFSEQGSFSFSQLLAGAMVSPMAAKQGLVLNSGSGNAASSSDEGRNTGNDGGYKRNRPVNLAVAQPVESLSPLFMVPPGLSPSGLLNSPGFLSPLQAEVKNAAADIEVSTQQTSSGRTELESSKIELSEVSQSDKRVGGEKPGGDGYNWRKYGQKHVKASECPRSYYKCTHLNCPVKKKVEQSADGQISEIVYKGHHNHDPPQNSRRGRDSSQSKSVLGTSQHALESNSETVDDVIVIGDGEDDEPPAKRKTVDPGQCAPARHTITESKIVVQTRSEVDLLDDGYKWRKYGQKVVKGNPHPRSYYRCTSSGCNVRKHVERSSADPKAVITTYEGKHNHEIPAGRYSQQMKKTQKEMNIGSSDQQMPLTLHLKQEQIAA